MSQFSNNVMFMNPDFSYVAREFCKSLYLQYVSRKTTCEKFIVQGIVDEER